MQGLFYSSYLACTGVTVCEVC